MKKCSICSEEKDLTQFNRNVTRKDGYQTMCKSCSRERSRRYYRENPTKHKLNVGIRNKAQRALNQALIIKYLRDHFCVDCGEKDIVVLEFDHLRDKRGNISKLTHSSFSEQSIWDEIAKCEVVCANCHKRRTAKQFNWFKAGEA